MVVPIGNGLFAQTKEQPWSLGRVSVGILMGAQRLAEERHSGARLRDLPESQQRDLCTAAADRLERYKEQ